MDDKVLKNLNIILSTLSEVSFRDTNERCEAVSVKKHCVNGNYCGNLWTCHSSFMSPQMNVLGFFVVFLNLILFLFFLLYSKHKRYTPLSSCLEA